MRLCLTLLAGIGSAVISSIVMSTERVLHLEADLCRSGETIQCLQQELAITKLAQTPTTDTHRYQLGVGPMGQGSSARPRSVEEVAVIVTETSVAKGMYT